MRNARQSAEVSSAKWRSLGGLSQEVVSGGGLKVTHCGRVLRILVCNRVDLGVSASDENVCLEEGLDVGVVALRNGLESYSKVIACEVPT